ncbi:MAG: dihydropteroate synthase [Sphingomonadales bacterium]
MFTLRNKERTLSVDKPVVMGILNITPDSFFVGSRYEQLDHVLEKAEQMLQNGATILDIGGQSSRPGSTRIDAATEWARIENPLRELVKRFPEAFISIDTYHAAVATHALNEGAFMINDISAGEMDKNMIDTVARAGAPYVIMHMRGTPATMQEQTQYDDLTQEVIAYLKAKKDSCIQRGITDLVVDPGFGFAKTIAQNFQLLAQLEKFSVLQSPLLLGISRKSFIYKTLGCLPEQALNGSTFLHAIGLQKGAAILRVHDVKEAVEAIRLFERMR